MWYIIYFEGAKMGKKMIPSKFFFEKVKIRFRFNIWVTLEKISIRPLKKISRPDTFNSLKLLIKFPIKKYGIIKGVFTLI